MAWVLAAFCTLYDCTRLSLCLKGNLVFFKIKSDIIFNFSFGKYNWNKNNPVTILKVLLWRKCNKCTQKDICAVHNKYETKSNYIRYTVKDFRTIFLAFITYIDIIILLLPHYTQRKVRICACILLLMPIHIVEKWLLKSTFKV